MDIKIKEAYKLAKNQYAKYGIDTDDILNKLKDIPISIHCWQGDDVKGFENISNNTSGGGILATGNYHGEARNINELKSDIEKAFSLIPGKKKLNLHAIYGDFEGRIVDRNEISYKHFISWIKWAKR
jgi:L-rhamnose isomerase